MSKGHLFVISGTSGVGKSTILEQLMKNRSDLLFSVSATTRAAREGERHGENYYFLTREEFESVINQLRQVMMTPPQPEPIQEKPALNLNF